MKLLEQVQRAKEGDTIEIGRLSECCNNLKDLEIISKAIKSKKLNITSKIQPWLNSDIFESILSEIIKIKEK